jgi:hypothetical protein
MEPYPWTHSLSKAFQRHQEHDLKHPGLVDLITTKQNKQPSFIDRLIYHRIYKTRTYPHNTHFYPQITKNIRIEIARFPHPIYKFTTSVCGGARRSQRMLEFLWMIAIFGSILVMDDCHFKSTSLNRKKNTNKPFPKKLQGSMNWSLPNEITTYWDPN